MGDAVSAMDISLQLDREAPVPFASALDWRTLRAWATPENAPRLEHLFRHGFSLDLPALQAELEGLEAPSELVGSLAAFLSGAEAGSLTVVYPE